MQNKVFNYSCLEGKVRVIVSGVRKSSILDQDFKITNKGNHYKVNKPWGHELWLNGDNQDYCLKEIYLKSDNQTSLQYHNLKEETNVLYKGDIKFVYKLDVDSKDIKSIDLKSIASIHVKPKSVHRIKALTDVILYETSTPHLKDVIRIEDDTNRANGHINSEHSNNKVICE